MFPSMNTYHVWYANGAVVTKKATTVDKQDPPFLTESDKTFLGLAVAILVVIVIMGFAG